MKSSVSELLLWTPSDPTSEIVASDLLDLAQDSRRSLQKCSDKEQITAALAANENTQLCLLYSRPEQHLGQSLDQGVSMEAAVADWRAQMQLLLDLYRGQRARCLVIETGHLQRYWELGIARLNLEPGSNDTPKIKPSTIPTVAPLLQLVAQSQHERQKDLKRLSDEIAASSINLSNKTPEGLGQLASDALAFMKAETEKAAKNDADHKKLIALRDDEIAELRKTLNVSKVNLSNAEVALAEQTDLAKELNAKLTEFQVARDFLTKQNGTLISDLRDVSTQNGTLRRDVQAFEADLKQRAKDIELLNAKFLNRENAHATELSDRANELNDLRHQREAEVQRLNDDIHRIMTSRSMRITAPMRWVLKLLGRKPNV